MKSTSLWLLAPPVLGLIVIGSALKLLEEHASYRSPLQVGAQSRPAPRDEALVDLEAWRQEKEREAAERAAFIASLDTEKMLELGKEIASGKGLCHTCHAFEDVGFGVQGPDLNEIGEQAKTRVPGKTDVEYLMESLYQPNAYVVEGYEASMPPVDQPPIELDDLEALMVIAYLQSLGATPTVTPETELTY